jgi:hypothetical protein
MHRLACLAGVALGLACVAPGSFAQDADPDAQLYKFSPPSTTFTATGQSAVSKGTDVIQCTMTAKLRTNAKGKLKYVSVNFSGGDSCPTAEMLPWKVKSPAMNSAEILDIEITSSLGDCNAPEFPMFLSDGAIILSFTFADCLDSFSASLPTTPALSIVPR